MINKWIDKKTTLRNWIQTLTRRAPNWLVKIIKLLWIIAINVFNRVPAETTRKKNRELDKKHSLWMHTVNCSLHESSISLSASNIFKKWKLKTFSQSRQGLSFKDNVVLDLI
jgi:hypothetical protein